MRRKLVLWGAALAALGASFGLWQELEVQANRPDHPRYVVEPSWPKSLPNQWQVGQVPGISVDRHDNIWIVQRPHTLTNDERGASDFDQPAGAPAGTMQMLNGAPRAQGAQSDCCLPAPSVMQFSPSGRLLRAWGGPADPGKCVETGNDATTCQWPNSEHGIYVDHNTNVWLGGQGGGSVLKFTADGTFLMQVGRRTPPVRNSNDTNGGVRGTPLLAQPADLEVDPQTNLAWIADGYTNLRVVVVDGNTGMYVKHFGAYGQNPVDDTQDEPGAGGAYVKNQAPSPNFRNPVHAVRITRDGLVYVADRTNDRIQVFDKNKVGAPCQNPGRQPGVCGFVKEFFVERDTLGSGSTWDVDVSPDWKQTYLFNADGTNQYVWTLKRATGQILDRFGRNGRNAGQFHWLHNLAIDSEGNMYTAEVDTGKRVQKFVLRDDRGGGRGRDEDDDD